MINRRMGCVICCGSALLVVGVIALLLTLASAGNAQAPRVPVILGIVQSPALDTLAAAWSEGPKVVERGYCITQSWTAPYPDSRVGDWIVRVIHVQRAAGRHATTHGVEFDCPKGQQRLHTHPVDWEHRGNCSASKIDRSALTTDSVSFSVVQCGRRDFVFYGANY